MEAKFTKWPWKLLCGWWLWTTGWFLLALLVGLGVRDYVGGDPGAMSGLAVFFIGYIATGHKLLVRGET